MDIGLLKILFTILGVITGIYYTSKRWAIDSLYRQRIEEIKQLSIRNERLHEIALKMIIKEKGDDPIPPDERSFYELHMPSKIKRKIYSFIESGRERTQESKLMEEVRQSLKKEEEKFDTEKKTFENKIRRFL